MEVGLLGKNIGAIIQVRIQSTRLPGKVLLPLPFLNGKPLIELIIESLKKSTLVNRIIIATSNNKENDIIETIAVENKVEIFRGSETDVLDRFVNVISLYNLDTVVRITGDNPILDHELMDQLITYHLSKKNDYTCSTNLPLGMNFEIINAPKLTEINTCDDISADDKEHVTLYFSRSGNYKTELKSLWPVSLTDKIRTTIDYPVDYAAMAIVASIAISEKKSGMELIEWIDKNYSWIWKINLNAFQKQSFVSLEDEKFKALELLETLGFTNVAEIVNDAILTKNE